MSVNIEKQLEVLTKAEETIYEAISVMDNAPFFVEKLKNMYSDILGMMDVILDYSKEDV